jgi:hypothetical protein
MKIRGADFDGSCTLYTTHKRLEEITRSAAWMSEYTPVDLDVKSVIEMLLRELHNYGVCCHISDFVTAYIAGKLAMSQSVALSIAVSSSTILNPLLQRRSGALCEFWVWFLPLSFIDASSRHLFQVQNYLGWCFRHDKSISHWYTYRMRTTFQPKFCTLHLETFWSIWFPKTRRTYLPTRNISRNVWEKK